LKKRAFKYPLKRSKYDFKKAATDAFDASAGGDEFEYIPNVPMTSEIVTYDEFAQVWRMLPEYAKIRVPELTFQASTDGYNVHTIYRKTADFKNDYKFSLVLIQTKTNNVFGAFLDDVFTMSSEYVGTNESFVFVLKPDIHVFRDQGVNARYLFGD
jgi:hypothetical protein